MADKHGFEDIVDQEQGIFSDGSAGISTESAMTQFQKAKPVPAPEGIIYEVMCENCGSRKIVVEWPEAVAIRNNISPHVAYQGRQVLQGSPTVWGFDPASQRWFPDIRCGQCRWQFRMMVTLGEIDQGLRAATSQGWISPAQIQQLSSLCAMVKQQAGMR